MTISDDERRDDGGDAQHQRPRVVPGARKDTMMRVDYRRIFPEAAQAMGGLEQAVRDSSLEPALLELVRMRASQLNGCAYCLDMHSKDARARGESEQRLYVLSAWQEAPFYSERERAALAWCEALTLLAQSGAPDDVYERLAAQFDEQQIVALTLAIVAINGWNRFAVGLRPAVGEYVSPQDREQVAPGHPAGG
jgi:AhpD family alkylhydroperoxidase